MRYAEARWNQFQREEVYRIYVTDGIRALVRSEQNPRWIDLLAEHEEETRTAEDIIATVRKSLGGHENESV